MLHYDGIDVSEGTDVNKKSASKECDAYYSLYFINYSLKFKPNVCNRRQDLLMMSINLIDSKISNVRGMLF